MNIEPDSKENNNEIEDKYSSFRKDLRMEQGLGVENIETHMNGVIECLRVLAKDQRPKKNGERLTTSEKKERRLRRNRIHARLNRDRQKVYVAMIERRVELQQNDINTLTTYIRELENENMKLKGNNDFKSEYLPPNSWEKEEEEKQNQGYILIDDGTKIYYDEIYELLSLIAPPKNQSKKKKKNSKLLNKLKDNKEKKLNNKNDIDLINERNTKKMKIEKSSTLNINKNNKRKRDEMLIDDSDVSNVSEDDSHSSDSHSDEFDANRSDSDDHANSDDMDERKSESDLDNIFTLKNLNGLNDNFDFTNLISDDIDLNLNLDEFKNDAYSNINITDIEINNNNNNNQEQPFFPPFENDLEEVLPFVNNESNTNNYSNSRTPHFFRYSPSMMFIFTTLLVGCFLLFNNTTLNVTNETNNNLLNDNNNFESFKLTVNNKNELLNDLLIEKTSDHHQFNTGRNLQSFNDLDKINNQHYLEVIDKNINQPKQHIYEHLNTENIHKNLISDPKYMEKEAQMIVLAAEEFSNTIPWKYEETVAVLYPNQYTIGDNKNLNQSIYQPEQLYDSSFVYCPEAAGVLSQALFPHFDQLQKNETIQNGNNPNLLFLVPSTHLHWIFKNNIEDLDNILGFNENSNSWLEIGCSINHAEVVTDVSLG